MRNKSYQVANERAKATGKVVGDWLAEAIREKAERQDSDHGIR